MLSDFIAHVGTYLDTHPAVRDFAIYAALSALASFAPTGTRAHTVLATLAADVRGFLPKGPSAPPEEPKP